MESRNIVLMAQRVEIEDDSEQATEWLYDRGMTDGLPIILPTERRVRAMIEAGGLDAQEVVGGVPPLAGTATVEKVAVNAVVAGCLPSYFPVVLTALRAMLEEPFNLYGVQTTTNPVGPLIIINGPIRRELQINAGANVMGPGSRANATIGRAIRLILINLGGAVPGKTDMATQGMPGKYTFCIAENEEESPWEPLHVERGFRPDESAVTVVPASGNTEICGSGSHHAEDAIVTIPKHMVQIGTNNFAIGREELFLLMSVWHAKEIAAYGFSKQAFKRHLYENCRAPVAWFSPRYRDVVKDRIINGEVVPAFSEDQFVLVVSGSDSGARSTFIPTAVAQSVTKKIPT